MTVYARVERFGAEPKFLQIKGLYVLLGEDAHGLLTSQDPMTPFFSIFCVDDRYFVQFERPEFRLDQKAVCTGRSMSITSGNVIEGMDYTFHLTIIGSEAEALAVSDKDSVELLNTLLQSDALPSVTVELGELRKTFPLYPDVQFSVGSDREATLLLAMEGIAPRHCLLCNSTSGVLVKSLDGKVKHDGRIVDQSLLLENSGTVLLGDGELPLMISFPQELKRNEPSAKETP